MAVAWLAVKARIARVGGRKAAVATDRGTGVSSSRAGGRRRPALRVLGALAVAAGLSLIAAGCSEIGFPAIHDIPAPRADATMTPDQVKQATDDLISQRDHLQGVPPPAATAASLAPQKTALKPAPAPLTTGSTQTAGADSRP